MEIMHKEAKITLRESDGLFTYMLDGQQLSSASLTAAKARIGKAQKAAFTAFDAIVPHYYKPHFRVVHIVGKKMAKSRFSAAKLCWLDNTGDTYDTVYPCTDETKHIFQKAEEMREEYIKAASEHGKVFEAELAVFRAPLVPLLLTGETK